MAKSKKKKIHKKIDGQLLQMNKKSSNLKMKQKDKITGWQIDSLWQQQVAFQTSDLSI